MEVFSNGVVVTVTLFPLCTDGRRMISALMSEFLNFIFTYRILAVQMFPLFTEEMSNLNVCLE